MIPNSVNSTQKILVQLDSEAQETKQSPLILAAHRGDLTEAKALVKTKGLLFSTDETQRTPLMRALISDHVAMVQFLVLAGSNLAALDQDNCGVFLWATLSYSNESDAYILRKDAQTKALFQALLEPEKPQKIETKSAAVESKQLASKANFNFQPNEFVFDRLIENNLVQTFDYITTFCFQAFHSEDQVNVLIDPEWSQPRVPKDPHWIRYCLFTAFQNYINTPKSLLNVLQVAVQEDCLKAVRWLLTNPLVKKINFHKPDSFGRYILRNKTSVRKQIRAVIADTSPPGFNRLEIACLQQDAELFAHELSEIKAMPKHLLNSNRIIHQGRDYSLVTYIISQNINAIFFVLKKDQNAWLAINKEVIIESICLSVEFSNFEVLSSLLAHPLAVFFNFLKDLHPYIENYTSPNQIQALNKIKQFWVEQGLKTALDSKHESKDFDRHFSPLDAAVYSGNKNTLAQLLSHLSHPNHAGGLEKEKIIEQLNKTKLWPDNLEHSPFSWAASYDLNCLFVIYDLAANFVTEENLSKVFECEDFSNLDRLTLLVKFPNTSSLMLEELLLDCMEEGERNEVIHVLSLAAYKKALANDHYINHILYKEKGLIREDKEACELVIANFGTEQKELIPCNSSSPVEQIRQMFLQAVENNQWRVAQVLLQDTRFDPTTLSVALNMSIIKDRLHGAKLLLPYLKEPESSIHVCLHKNNSTAAYVLQWLLFNNNDPLKLGYASQDSMLLKVIPTSNSAPIESEYFSQGSALHQAIHYNNFVAVQILLEAKMDLEIRDQSGMTPLLKAMQYGHKNIVTALVSKGANKLAKDNSNRNIFYHALYNEAGLPREDKDACELLQALFYAEQKELTPDEVKIFNDQKVDVYLKAVENNQIRVVQLLLDHRDPKEYDRLELILLFAIQNDKIDITKSLLSYHPQPRVFQDFFEYKDNSSSVYALQWSLLNHPNRFSLDVILNKAIENNNLRAVKILLTEEKLNLEARNRYGETPLLCAMRSGHKDIIPALVSKGANRTAQDTYRDVFYWTLTKGNNQPREDKEACEFLQVLLGTEQKESIREEAKTFEAQKQNALVRAVENNLPTSARFLLEKGTHIDMSGEGKSPLWCAIEKDNLSLGKLLLNYHPTPNTKTLFFCLKTNNSTAIDVRDWLLANKVGDQRQYEGLATLQRTLFSNTDDNPKTIQILLESKEYLAAQDLQCLDFLLFIAVYLGLKNCAALFLSAGANKTVIFNYNSGAYWDWNSILYCAIHKQQGLPRNDGEACKLLQVLIETKQPEQKKSVIFEKTEAQIFEEQKTAALFCAVKSNLSITVKFLLEKGVPIATCKFLRSPLWEAVGENNLGMTKLLLNYLPTPDSDMLYVCVGIKTEAAIHVINWLVAKKVDLNAKHDYGKTSLHKAIEINNLEAVQILIEAKADLEVQDEYNGTPLLYAASVSNRDAMTKLVSSGCNRTSRSPFYVDVFRYILDKHGKRLEDKQACELVDTLFRSEHKESNLEEAKAFETLAQDALRWTVENQPAVAKFLLEKGVKIVTSNSDKSPLWWAVISNNLDITRLLLTYLEPSPEILHICVTIKNSTAIHVLNWLLQNKINPNVRHDGYPALHPAIACNNQEAVQILLKEKADMEATNLKFGNTALAIALDYGQIEIVKILVAAGANITTTNQSNQSLFGLVLKNRERKPREDKEASELLKALLFGKQKESKQEKSNQIFEEEKQKAINNAVLYNQFKTVNFLLATVKIDIKSGLANHILHTCATMSNETSEYVLNWLIEKGIDTEIRRHKQTALERAINSKNSKAIQILIAVKTKLDARHKERNQSENMSSNRCTR